MSKSKGELATFFRICAESTARGEFERQLYSAAAPIVRFFDTFGFRRQSYTGTIAILPLAKGQINLTMSEDCYEGGSIKALVFGLTHQPEHGHSYNHFRGIRVSLNAANEGQYTLFDTNPDLLNPDITSGDPRKVLGPFLSEMEGPLEELFIPKVNQFFHFGQRHLSPRHPY